MHRPVVERSLFRHFHSVQLEAAPDGRSSEALMAIDVLGGRVFIRFSHSVTRRVSASAHGLTSLTKLFLDLSRLTAGLWLNRGWRSSIVWRCLSLLLAAFLRISGGAIPDRMYKLSTGVGLRHPVISRQVALRAGSIFFACVDLSQTGQAYSAAE